MKYRVNWDNGAEDCGTFPYVFDTEEEAGAFAENWMHEMDYDDGEGYFAEVIEVEDEPEPDEEELIKREPWE